MKKAYKRLILMVVIILISNMITIGIMNKVNENKIKEVVKNIIVVENEKDMIEINTVEELQYLVNKCTLDNTKEFIECD